MSNALDDLAKIREVLKDELKEEALKLQALELVERVAETPDEKLKDFELDIKRKLLLLGSSSSCQNHGRFNSFEDAFTAYKRETGEVVYDAASFERFARWLYTKKCDDSCPFYRIVEGEGDTRSRCTNPIGACANDDKSGTEQEEAQITKVKKPLAHVVGDMVVDAVCDGISNYLYNNYSKNFAELNDIIKYIKVEWTNKIIEDIK